MNPSPLRVAIIDEVELHRVDLYTLLARDPNVFAQREWCFDTPADLSTQLSKAVVQPELIILAVGWRHALSLQQAIGALRAACPQAAIICSSDRMADDSLALAVRDAISAGANGFIDRQDVSYGVSALLALMPEQHFLCTPYIRPFVERHLPRSAAYYCAPCWQMYHEITPAERKVAEYFFLRGLTAKSTSQLADLAQPSVTEYKKRVRRRVRHALEEGYYHLPLRQDLSPSTKLTDEDVFYVLTRLPLAI